MKPLRLNIQAFGPYLAEQTLDFEALAGKSLFLIHGPTGAGKTSIFDAITYAFYGCGSGDDRAKPDGLRSDHAPAELRTEVSLDFALGENRYRVIRKAEFQRPKQRGEGFKLEPASAELLRLEPGEQGYREAEKLAAGWEKVNKAVEGLLKLGVRQFCQVIILPQGQFRRFLSGTSGEREKILEILFRTTRYKKIQDNLDARASEITKAFKELEGQMKGLLQSHEGAESVDVILAAKAAAEELSTSLQTEATGLSRERDAAQAALHGAEQSQKLFREHAEATAALTQVNARAAEMALLAKELESAEQAEPARYPDERLRGALAEAKKIAESLPACRTAVTEAATNLKAADEKLAAARGREEEKSRLELRLQSLTEIGKELSSLEELRKDATAAAEWRKKAIASGEGLEKDLSTVENSLPDLRKLESSLHQECESVGSLRQALEHKRAIEKDARSLSDTRGRREKSDAFHAAASTRVKEQEAALAAAEAKQTLAQDAWVKGQAAILAAALRAGDACPVCGSEDHPALASAAHPEAPKDSLAAAKAVVDQARAGLDRAKNECFTQENERSALNARVSDLEERLRAAGFTTPEALRAEVAALEEKLKMAEAARGRLTETGEKLKAAEARIHAIKTKLTAHNRELIDASETAMKAQTRVEEIEARVAAQEIKTLAEARQAYAATGRAIEEIKKLLAEATSARELALQKDLSAKEACRSAERQEVENASLVKTCREEFNAALVAAGFTAEEAFRAALRPLPRLREIQQTLKAFESGRAAASTRLELAEKAIAGKEPVDPGPLAEKVKALQSALAELSRRLGDANARAAQAARLLADIAALSDKRSALHEEYSVLGKMAEVAKGGNEKGMSFQRYVLATFLDEVVETASLRLRQSSKGRYTLKRATSHEDLRKTGGLELVVEDGWHGTVRPVSTLSGGEGFQASLALALGLAEVVQAEAGGVYLDAVFIDEGFGTLDSEALDLALRTLMDLQKGGRLVGIISHVPELKQIIPSRVEIKADRLGSRIVTV
jgi:exonuclease SbcC